ncbi:Fe-S metabolism associated SufE [Niabella ginsenosidivorans]|uniref:Fe-S metabolism associated SufE n=1 Tax=Niabella ginsenosidivorans TaxID=1176587 RepID=A0A1A9I023_9BACT|nr:SufE family protein [Niabella ginsenosidivorans]ANH81007.1 Fe-S metabolism associated SufE [Niabella ginsenosidivorans]
MDINKIQDAIISEFDHFTDYLNRFSYFRHLRKITTSDNDLDTAEKKEENLVAGCSKKVWITATTQDGKIYFKADSENNITRGLVNLLVKVYSGNTAAAITNADLYFLHEIRLFNYLSPSRLQDFLSISKRIKSLAIAQHLKTIK